MFIRKFSFNGYGGASEKVTLDFTPANNKKTFPENIETFGLERNLPEFQVLRTIGMIGLNASGKTTILDAIRTGVQLIVNPNLAVFRLAKDKNVFSDGVVSWEYEFVFKPETTNDLARKYILQIKYDTNTQEVLEEKLSFQKASKTSFTKMEEVLHMNENSIKILGFTSAALNRRFPISHAIRLGFLPEDISETLRREGHLEFLTKIDTQGIDTDLIQANEQKMNSVPGIGLSLPRKPKDLKKWVDIIKAFDPSIEDIYDKDGKITIDIRGVNDEIRTVEFNRIKDVLSTGTFIALHSHIDIFYANLSSAITLKDEVDKAAHPGLLFLLVELYKTASKGQFIFTTHATEILEQRLRLDQIMYVVKENGIILTKKVSDVVTDERSITSKKIIRNLKSNPDPIAINKILNAWDE